MNRRKECLADDVYLEFKDDCFVLTREDAVGNVIATFVLTPRTFVAFQTYCARALLRAAD